MSNDIPQHILGKVYDPGLLKEMQEFADKESEYQKNSPAEPKRCPETGATWKDFMDAKPAEDAQYQGRPIIFGTPGDDLQGDLKELFEKTDWQLPEGDFVDPSMEQKHWYPLKSDSQAALDRESSKIPEHLKQYPMTPDESFPGTGDKTLSLVLRKEDMGTPEWAKVMEAEWAMENAKEADKALLVAMHQAWAEGKQLVIIRRRRGRL